jgi:hypothetical protein
MINNNDKLEEIRKHILEKARVKAICRKGAVDGLKASTMEEGLLVIKQNIDWLLDNKIVDEKWLNENFNTTINEIKKNDTSSSE